MIRIARLQANSDPFNGIQLVILRVSYEQNNPLRSDVVIVSNENPIKYNPKP